MPQAGAVAVLQEVVGVLAVLQRRGQGAPHAAELLRVAVAAALAGDGQGGGRLDSHLEVLARGDHVAEGGECCFGPGGCAWKTQRGKYSIRM